MAGQSTEEFTESFNEDNLGGLLDVLQGLGELDSQEVVLTLDELNLSALGLSRILPLVADNVQDVRDSIELSNQAYIDNQALIAESDRRYATFSSQVLFLRNQLTALSATAGNEFLDDLAESAQTLTEQLSGFDVTDSFRRIGDAISRILQIINDEGDETVSTVGLIAIGMSEFADSVADGVGFMAELTESAGTLNLELNPVRAIFQGLALTAFVIQNAFRQLPDALIIFSSGFRRSLLQIQSDLNDVLSNFCLLYTSPSPRDLSTSRMPSSA